MMRTARTLKLRNLNMLICVLSMFITRVEDHVVCELEKNEKLWNVSDEQIKDKFEEIISHLFALFLVVRWKLINFSSNISFQL